MLCSTCCGLVCNAFAGFSTRSILWITASAVCHLYLYHCSHPPSCSPSPTQFLDITREAACPYALMGDNGFLDTITSAQMGGMLPSYANTWRRSASGTFTVSFELFSTLNLFSLPQLIYRLIHHDPSITLSGRICCKLPHWQPLRRLSLQHHLGHLSDL